MRNSTLSMHFLLAQTVLFFVLLVGVYWLFSIPVDSYVGSPICFVLYTVSWIPFAFYLRVKGMRDDWILYHVWKDGVGMYFIFLVFGCVDLCRLLLPGLKKQEYLFYFLGVILLTLVPLWKYFMQVGIRIRPKSE